MTTSLTNYHAGRTAEDIVGRMYERLGYAFAARRWRGTVGEIDLVYRRGAQVVFVEVKKSRSFGRAAERLSARQIERIMATASEFVADEPKGQLTEMRFDVALVDRKGAVDLIENALMAA